MIGILTLCTALFCSTGTDLHVSTSTTQVAPSESESAAQLVRVRSPWGYCALYHVRCGHNCLRCAGTGRTFSYWH